MKIWGEIIGIRYHKASNTGKCKEKSETQPSPLRPEVTTADSFDEPSSRFGSWCVAPTTHLPVYPCNALFLLPFSPLIFLVGGTKSCVL